MMLLNKINEVKGEIPSVTNLATTSALTTVGNKIPNVSDLVKKSDYDDYESDYESNYFTTTDYNNFASNTLDAKITQKKLVNESDIDEKIKTLASKEETKALVTKAELKAEQDKIVKLQTYDLSPFIGQSYFNIDESLNYLIFQPTYKALTTFSGLTSTISEWNSRLFSNEKLTPPYTANKISSPKQVRINNSRIRL